VRTSIAWLAIIVGAIGITWMLGHEREVANMNHTIAHAIAPTLAPTFAPAEFRWQPSDDRTFVLEHGETFTFTDLLSDTEQFRVSVEAAMPVNFVTPCSTDVEVRTLKTESVCDREGKVIIEDARTNDTDGMMRTVFGAITHNNEMLNAAMRKNRVHVLFLSYVCIAHCPKGEYITSPTSR
jgi:hypothetical protein